MNNIQAEGAGWRGLVLLALWLCPALFAFSSVAGALPVSYQTQINIGDIGVLAGALSVLSVPIAGVMTVVWWKALTRSLRVSVMVVALIGLVSLVFFPTGPLSIQVSLIIYLLPSLLYSLFVYISVFDLEKKIKLFCSLG